MTAKETIQQGKAILGIEFGSTGEPVGERLVDL